MNMIKTLCIVASIVLAIFLVPGVLGAEQNYGVNVTGGKLWISDVDVKVDGQTSKNMEDGDSIDDEAKPGSTVSFNIEVYNAFPEDSKVKIEDTTVTVTIVGIDDDDDLEEESKEFDVKVDDTEKVTIDFEIPLAVDEDTYDVEILVEGDTNDNGTQKAKMDLTLDVEKENNEIRFTRNSLSPSEIKCERSVQLSTAVINTGSDEQSEAVIEVSNAALGISARDTFDLSDDPFDEDGQFKKTYTLAIPDNVAPGVYTIETKVLYDDGTEVETKTAELIINQCEVVQQETEPECEADADCDSDEICDKGVCVANEEQEVVVVQPPVKEDQETEPVITPPVLVTESKSFLENSGFLAVLIAGEVLLLLVAILIIVAIFRKRN
jgi:hypothetical protein